MEKISFVIPIYNSEKSIGKVVNRIEELMMVDLQNKYNYEIILTNDGSKDNSIEVCKDICKKNPNVRFFNLSRNFGQHSAVLSAFNHVTGDYVVNLDDDLQTDPIEVKNMLLKLKNENYDLVYARYKEKKHSVSRKIGTKINTYMSEKMMDKPKDISIGSFYITKRFVIDEVIKYDGAFPYVSGLLLRVTRNIANVDVEHKERAYGSSNYTFKKLLALWINGFTNFSIKPIRLFTYIGMILLMVSSASFLFLIGNKIINNDFNLLRASLYNVLVFLASINLVAIGVVGEYVGRIFMLSNNAPQYVVKEEYSVPIQSNVKEKEINIV